MQQCKEDSTWSVVGTYIMPSHLPASSMQYISRSVVGGIEDGGGVIHYRYQTGGKESMAMCRLHRWLLCIVILICSLNHMDAFRTSHHRHSRLTWGTKHLENGIKRILSIQTLHAKGGELRPLLPYSCITMMIFCVLILIILLFLLFTLLRYRG